jgi:tight adherence protein C
MGLAIFIFCDIFLLVACVLLFMSNRESAVRRLSEAIDLRPKRRRQRSLKAALQQTGSSLGGVMGQLEQVLPKSQKEKSIVQQRLVYAGFRNESALNIFYGAKVLIPLIAAALVAVTGIAKDNPFIIYLAALGIGFLVPDFWLGRRIKERQKHIERGLPDVLDLLVICMEAGLSLDQATKRTSEELVRAQPELCDELNLVVLEQRAGQARADAWKHLADRTGMAAIRNLVTMLVQAEQFGTSIARTMRVHSETLRTQRVQKVQEQAAKTSVKLVFPLVIFIFPALFLVTLGPAALLMMDSFKQMMNH